MPPKARTLPAALAETFTSAPAARMLAAVPVTVTEAPKARTSPPVASTFTTGPNSELPSWASARAAGKATAATAIAARTGIPQRLSAAPKTLIARLQMDRATAGLAPTLRFPCSRNTSSTHWRWARTSSIVTQAP